MKENWKYKKLTDVVWFQEGPGVRNTQYTDSGVKLLNVANLINGKVDLSTSKRYISEEEAYGKYRHFLVDEGDFIIASSGIQVEYFEKKMGFISASQLPLCMNTSTIRFKALDKNVLNMRFFMYYLKSEDFKHQLSRQITGIAQLNFGPLHLKRMSMPITDFETQSRIVSELDLLQSIIDKQKAQLKELDNLAQAVFYDMFGDPVENEKGWEVKKLGDECTDMKYGTSRPSCENGKYSYLRMCNISSDGHLDLNNLKTIDVPDDEVEKCIVRYGDILFNRTNSIDLIGKTCMFDLETPMIIAGYIIRVRLSENLESRFVSCMFNMPSMKKLLRAMAKGAVNQANINSKELASIIIPIPPVILQHSFASKNESIEKQKAAINQSIAETQKLFDYTMDKYFG